MKLRTSISIFAMTASMVISSSAIAGNHGNQAHGHSDHGHVMDQKEMASHAGHKSSDVREVMASGRVNKVMAGHGMVNINHEPIPEMKWPRMNMNFKTQPQVNLASIEPGQQVDFKLLVSKDNSYVIKEIVVK